MSTVVCETVFVSVLTYGSSPKWGWSEIIHKEWLVSVWENSIALKSKRTKYKHVSGLNFLFQWYKLFGSSSFMLVNHGFGKLSIGDCRLKTPALRCFPPSDEGRRDASPGRAWARRFMGDDEVPQLTLDTSPLCVIFPARFWAIVYIWLKILKLEKNQLFILRTCFNKEIFVVDNWKYFVR